MTLGKVMVKSGRPGKKKTPLSGKEEKGRKPLIIMGNGPSLRETLQANGDLLLSCPTMAVNFAANTDEFFRLKPRHYVLADPHFFKSGVKDQNVKKLWENIGAADWEMTLHVPCGAKIPSVSLRQNIETRRFNMTPAEGYDFVCHPLLKKGLALPRPRNVLIPAIMEGIREGYGEIYIVGADHTWPHTLYVDDRNRVVTVQPHFYKEDPKELDRIAEVYAGVRLHDVLGSMVVAFRSYHQIEKYARKRGVTIFNATPGSLIDAFRRKPLK